MRGDVRKQDRKWALQATNDCPLKMRLILGSIELAVASSEMKNVRAKQPTYAVMKAPSARPLPDGIGLLVPSCS